jgi:hypothetical protein
LAYGAIRSERLLDDGRLLAPRPHAETYRSTNAGTSATFSRSKLRGQIKQLCSAPPTAGDTLVLAHILLGVRATLELKCHFEHQRPNGSRVDRPLAFLASIIQHFPVLRSQHSIVPVATDPAMLLRRAPARQIVAVVPAAINGRLEALIRVADEAGVPTSRKELVAAIVHGAPTSPGRLRALIARYRSANSASVDEALVAYQPLDLEVDPLGAPVSESPPPLPDAILTESPSPFPGSDVRISVKIPEPLKPRLDSLVKRAKGTHGDLTRQELLAALILSISELPRRLARLLQNYRTASVEATIIKGDDPERYLQVMARKPGRPTGTVVRRRRVAGAEPPS